MDNCPFFSVSSAFDLPLFANLDNDHVATRIASKF